MTSTARSDMRLASSWILMASGMITSRTSFSFGSLGCCPFRRWGGGAEGGERAFAHVMGIECSGQRQASALLLRRRLGGGLWRRRGADDAAGAATDLARAVVLVGNVGGDTGRARRGGGSRGP